VKKYTVAGNTGSTLVFTACTIGDYKKNLQNGLGERMIFSMAVYESLYEMKVELIRCENEKIIFKCEPHLQ
jgi:hypothetical protein